MSFLLDAPTNWVEFRERQSYGRRTMENWRRIRQWVLVGILLSMGAFVGGCSNDDDEGVCSDEVKTRVDADADFASYETYAIADFDWLIGMGGMGGGSNDVEVPDDVQTDIDTANRAAADELEERGLQEADPEDADLLIVSAAATQEMEGTYWACTPGPGWYWWWYYWYWDPCAWLVPIDFEYTVGSLIVSLVDPRTNEPVFAGGAQGILECTDDVDSLIEEVVDEMFEDYPDVDED